MKYESKIFNLESYSIPENWLKEEFNFAVEVLESLDRATLFKLVDQFNIKFHASKEHEKYLEDEELISVLVSDAPKDRLLKELREIVNKPPLSFKSFSFRK